MLKGHLYINDDVFDTLLALTVEEQSRGLMFVEEPTPIMSFCYEVPQFNTFWMKNTPAPLDIIFCLKGKIDKICYGKPFSTEIITNSNLSDLIVEMPYGTCKKLGFKSGDNIGIIKKNNL